VVILPFKNYRPNTQRETQTQTEPITQREPLKWSSVSGTRSVVIPHPRDDCHRPWQESSILLWSCPRPPSYRYGRSASTAPSVQAWRAPGTAGRRCDRLRAPSMSYTWPQVRLRHKFNHIIIIIIIIASSRTELFYTVSQTCISDDILAATWVEIWQSNNSLQHLSEKRAISVFLPFPGIQKQGLSEVEK